MSDAPLVLVSNRGPVTYQEDGSVKRGTGGLVTALTGLASHRDAIWIASAMTDQDVEVAQEHGGKPFEVSAPSVTITRPASGNPASSSRARSRAWPTCVVVPLY